MTTDTAPVSHLPTGRAPGPARWSFGRIGRLTALTVISAFFLVPMIGFTLMGFRNENDFKNGSLGGVSFANARRSWRELMAFNNGVFGEWIRHSLQVSVGGAVLAVVAGLPAGYAMSRLRFRGRKLLRFATLITMVMPNTVLVIPLFLEVSRAGAIDKLWPVIVIMGFFPFGVYLSYIHFSTALPRELVEAARIDGLTDVGTFFRVAVPLGRQAVALVFFFSFVANWTNYFLPLVLLPVPENATVSVGLQQLIGSSPLVDPTTAAGLDVKLYMPQLAFATLITMIPVLVVFIAAQKFLMRGQIVGAVKG